jgi:hypothetical protein
MNKQLIASICVLGLVGMVVGVVAQADNTVTATVTPGVVSVSLDRNTTSYGIMLIGESKADPAGAITATAGSVEININFTGADATYNDYAWTLTGTPGEDAYKHSATIGSTETPLTTGAQTLVTDLAAAGTEDFTLKIYTPTTGGAETLAGNVYSTTVTLTAIDSR